MELLLSDIPPLRSNNRSFTECFEELISKSDHVKIASGYVSAESLEDIKDIVEEQDSTRLDLMIGMHYFDGISRPQYDAAISLHNLLLETHRGAVTIANTLKFHGKLYSFSQNNSPFASIIGSSNISNIINIHRNFETDILLEEKNIVSEIERFITCASEKISLPISEWKPEKFLEYNQLLEEIDTVEKVDKLTLDKIKQTVTGIKFCLPLKATKKSNLNVPFGKGRENTGTKRVKHRAWFETEIIVPKSTRKQKNYPAEGKVFTVYTDDGWKFNCYTGGSGYKNLRSKGNLKVLGRWLKGRLVNSGAVKVGDFITNEMLHAYGRNSLLLQATADPNVWMLDFGV